MCNFVLLFWFSTRMMWTTVLFCNSLMRCFPLGSFRVTTSWNTVWFVSWNSCYETRCRRHVPNNSFSHSKGLVLIYIYIYILAIILVIFLWIMLCEQHSKEIKRDNKCARPLQAYFCPKSFYVMLHRYRDKSNDAKKGLIFDYVEYCLYNIIYLFSFYNEYFAIKFLIAFVLILLFLLI